MTDTNKIIFRRIATLFYFVTAVPWIYIGWKYKKGVILSSDAKFWSCVFAGVIFWVAITISLITKESVAKGITIQKDKSPFLYAVSLIIDVIVFCLAIVGTQCCPVKTSQDA